MESTKEKLKSWYSTQAKERDYWRKRHSFYHQEIVNLARFLIPKDVSLLEIGCGTGELLASIPARKKMGVDLSRGVLELAREKFPQIEFREDDAEKLKIRQKFEYVLMSEVVGSFLDVELALKNVNQVIEKTGRLVIIYHNYLWQPFFVLAEKLGLKAKAPLQNWLTAQDIENLLYLSGFEIIRSGKRMLVPWNVPIFSWLLNRVIARLPLLSRLGMIQYIVARPFPVLVQAKPTLSVIVPARNEKGNIESIVRRLPHFPAETEIIFVEGHSKDGTWQEIERIQNKYSHARIIAARQDGKGKGDAVRKGFAIAQGEVLAILDADMTVLPEDLPKFYEAIAAGKGELVMGSRLVYPLEGEAMRFLNVLGNKFFAVVFSWLLSQPIKDTLCGTKVLRKSDYERIAENRSYFGDFDPFGDFDLIFGAAKINLKIMELPVRYKERVYGSTQISRFRHGWLLLKMCFFAARKFKFMQ